MTTPELPMQRSEGRTLFGSDPAAYARVRPDYPERVYEILQTRCGLGPGARVLEVGAGAGTATRRLVEMTADVLAVEPDRRSAAYLRASLGTALEVRATTFERARLRKESFDLVVAGTSFHWVDPAVGLAKTASVLRPGGWLALFWNVFGDPDREFPFHDATTQLLSRRAGGLPSGYDNPVLDVQARAAEIDATGSFDHLAVDIMRWELTSTAGEIRALYSTFSTVTRLPVQDRLEVLDELERIAREEFGGRVWRPMMTILYTVRRKAKPGALPTAPRGAHASGPDSARTVG